MRKFLGMFGGKRSAQPNQDPMREESIQPDAPFFAVGDIHGRADLLHSLLEKIGTAGDEQIIFVGDYVDRGPDAAAVLKKLYDLSHDQPGKIVCLKGNHEKMMCDFIDDPLDRGALWLRNGGRQTLSSFGIDIPKAPEPDEILGACDAFEEVLPMSLLAWIRDLPLTWHSGNMWCVHAAMHPERAPDMQRTDALLWGHRLFLDHAREDGNFVIHGHTIVPQPIVLSSRIAIDTGAYKTGRLTAAHVSVGACRFVST